MKRMLKSLLPPAVARELSQLHALAGKERFIHLKTRLSDSVGLTSPRYSRPPKTARSFLFVCFGNIMRSPMCEALMNRAIRAIPGSKIAVTSAGLNAVPGREPHAWAIRAAREFGISLEDHRARILTAKMVDDADAIFAMDRQNQVQLLSRYPPAKGKVYMLSAYAAEDYRSLEIVDPYYTNEDGTRRCYAILNTCIENLVHSLRHEGARTV
jgi:protein-tyrosine phosphatase